MTDARRMASGGAGERTDGIDSIGRIVVFVFLAILAVVPPSSRAGSVTGADWIVRFNLPDQTTSYKTIGTDEFLLRDAWIARIDALQKGDWACLSTYTFSGPSGSVGAAGPILAAVSNALARGAGVGFVAAYGIDVASNYWPGCSLKSLAARKGNPLKLSRAPSGGIMHDKLGVFWYKSRKERWVLSGSWNYTGGASSQQWNILAEIRNDKLAAAVSNELSQMLAGHFHADKEKSHAPDNTRFRLASGPADSWVRFAPYPDGAYGGDNALRDITNAIAAATTDIYFSLNKLTRADVVDQLIRACNRGVTVHGVIPKSDRLVPSDDSYAMYTNLLRSSAYTTANRVRLFDAWYAADRTSYDNNNRDLVHTKYMVIDPLGARPLVIHGSANWTASALVYTAANDENVLFLSDPGIAAAFLAQFQAETDGLDPRLLSFVPGKSTLTFTYWLPPLPATFLPSALVASPSLTAPSWTRIQSLSASPGTHTLSVPATTNAGRFFRLR
jgi:hypothetical protein